MIIAAIILLIPACIAWLIVYLIKNSGKNDKRVKVYTEGIVVGYDGGGFETKLCVRFEWNGTLVKCYTESGVSRSDYPEGSTINIFYHPEVMRRPKFANHDYISGIVFINEQKQIEKRERFNKRALIMVAILGSILTLLSASFLIAGIIG